MDSGPAELYRIQGIPAFLLIDGDGNIVERFYYIDYPPDADFLDLIVERLEELLAN